jgi:Protein of unknown function (DUF1566)
MKVTWQAEVVLVLFSLVAVIASGQSPKDQSSAERTQVRGNWVDPSTGLMWAGKDNGEDVNWQKASEYCSNLRLAGYSDWRLATIDELEGVYEWNANAPGEIPQSDKHEALVYTFDIKGNIFLTGDPWSSDPIDDNPGHPAKNGWYFNFNRGKRNFDALRIALGRRALCVRRSSIAPNSQATETETIPSPFRSRGQDPVQKTQALGYWTDSATGLMWAARDNGKRVSWHKATKYCRSLRLAGYSDWRLATIDELEGLVNLRAYAPQSVGSVDYLHWNGDLQVNGGLLLTYDRQWSASPLIDVHGRPSNASFWYFDYQRGEREKGFEDWAEGDTMQALCVRDTKDAPVPASNGAAQAGAPSETQNQNRALEAHSPATWADPSTGLVWTTADNHRDVNLGAALRYCRDLRIAALMGWRLPTIDELEGIRASVVAPPDDAGKQDDHPFTDRVTGKLLLTGDPWSSSPVDEESEWPPDFVWYLNVESSTRLFDEPDFDHARRALCVQDPRAKNPPGGVATANARSSSQEQESKQETQLRGYWIDPSTSLMWTGHDNLQPYTYWDAPRHCRDLRLAHYSDWRLPTIDELQGIYDKNTAAPGENPRTHWHEPEPWVFHVKGGLFLTGDQLSSTSENDGSGSIPEYVWGFDFKSGSRFKDKPDRHVNMRVLCVRHAGE